MARSGNDCHGSRVNNKIYTYFDFNIEVVAGDNRTIDDTALGVLLAHCSRPSAMYGGVQ